MFIVADLVSFTRGKVFSARIRSALLHGSETWAPTAPDLQRLRINDDPLDLRFQTT